MKFEHLQFIWVFLLLPVFLIIFIWFFKKYRRALFQFIAPEHLKKTLPRFAPNHFFLRFIFFFCALICFTIAILAPYSDVKERLVKYQGAEVYFLVDLSSSMLAQDIKPSRLQRAVFEIKNLLENTKGDRFGLIAFAGEAFIVVPLTQDRNAFYIFLNELNPDLIPVSGTNIKSALEKSVQSFATQSKNKTHAVILISDGEDSVGLDPKTINHIKEKNIKVFVLGIGTQTGAPIPLSIGGYQRDQNQNIVVSRLNEKSLRNLAVETGGEYFNIDSTEFDLKSFYDRKIKASDLNHSMESVKKIPDYIFQPFILAGIIFLILEILITNYKFSTRFFSKKTKP